MCSQKGEAHLHPRPLPSPPPATGIPPSASSPNTASLLCLLSCTLNFSPPPPVHQLALPAVPSLSGGGDSPSTDTLRNLLLTSGRPDTHLRLYGFLGDLRNGVPRLSWQPHEPPLTACEAVVRTAARPVHQRWTSSWGTHSDLYGAASPKQLFRLGAAVQRTGVLRGVEWDQEDQ